MENQTALNGQEQADSQTENLEQTEGHEDDLREQIKAELQKDFDRKITAAKTKLETNAYQKAKAELEQQFAEAEKLKKMEAEERIKYLQESTAAELAKRDKELSLVNYMSENKIPLEYKKFLTGDTPEDFAKSWEEFNSILEEAKKKVNQEWQAKTSHVPGTGTNNSKTMTLAEFNKLESRKRAEFMNSGGQLVN